MKLDRCGAGEAEYLGALYLQFVAFVAGLWVLWDDSGNVGIFCWRRVPLGPALSPGPGMQYESGVFVLNLEGVLYPSVTPYHCVREAA